MKKSGIRIRIRPLNERIELEVVLIPPEPFDLLDRINLRYQEKSGNDSKVKSAEITAKVDELVEYDS